MIAPSVPQYLFFMPHLCVIDANASWIRSLADGMPEDWSVANFKVFHPLWLPNGLRDLPHLFRRHRTGPRSEETLIATPGWRRFNTLSAHLTAMFLKELSNPSDEETVVLFTFPFYSELAKIVRKKFPRVRLAYWAHDAFAYYAFPEGFVEYHEDRLVPLCDARFAMAPLLVEDYARRYPDHPFGLLHDAVASNFLTERHGSLPRDIEKIRQSGRLIVGCIGQINHTYDWDLLEAAATANPATQFVFIGNLFEEGEITNRIRRYFELANVHWLGRVDHERLPDYLRGFDICLNPLAVSDHNHRRDPLRIYDYLTTDAPILSTDLDGVRMHRDFVEIIPDPAEFISRLSDTPDRLPESQLEARRNYISGNTWQERALEFVAKIESLPEHSRGPLK